MTFPNPKWNPGPISANLDAAAAVDKGGGEVGLPVTGHSFKAEQVVIVAGTVNYNPVGDGTAYEINSQTANEIVITATYVAEVFDGSETVDFDRQPIVKADFRALEDQIQGQPSVRMQPDLVYVDAATVKILATADCIATMAMSGMPNILNPVVQVSGDLSDGVIRTSSSDVSLSMASDIWGVEKTSQYYAILALAEDNDTTFTLKAMPLLRVCSDDEGTKVISLGTNYAPATGRRYGFTVNEFVAGKVYILSGAGKGLMRSITANDAATGADGMSGTITYTGDALSLAQGDWFIVLPPGTNFRFLGEILNLASGDIEPFNKVGNKVERFINTSISFVSPNGVIEDMFLAPPLATELHCNISSTSNANVYIGHPSSTDTTGAYRKSTNISGDYHVLRLGIVNCKIYTKDTYTLSILPKGYSYPPGCGY